MIEESMRIEMITGMAEIKRDKPSVSISAYSMAIVDQQADTATRSGSSTNLFKSTNKRSPYRPNRNIDLSQIKGPTGSVRGHKDVVKRSLENIRVVSRWTSNFKRCFDEHSAPSLSSFVGPNSSANSSLISHLKDDTYKEEYLCRLMDEEHDRCVAYTTTLGVVRRTFEDSKLMRSILNLNLIKYEERDIYLNQEYKLQLQLRINEIRVPALFIDGHYFMGIRELELMNESGELAKRLSRFKMNVFSRATCLCCGNAKFIACQSCNGSRKSTIHHFKFNSVALRCIKCDKNGGLVHCPICYNKNPVELDDENNNNCPEYTSKI